MFSISGAKSVTAFSIVVAMGCGLAGPARAQSAAAEKCKQAIEAGREDDAACSDTGEMVRKGKLAAAPVPIFNWTGFYIGGEAGGSWIRNRFEELGFNGTGFLGGISGQFRVPLGSSGFYTGIGASVLGSTISGTDAGIKSDVRLLVPIDGIFGTTYLPSGLQWPISFYGFGGLAVGDVQFSSSPFSATQTMTGWSAGAALEVLLTPNWSADVKYRHFDLGKANYSLFPGFTSSVTERGDAITSGLNYHFGP